MKKIHFQAFIYSFFLGVTIFLGISSYINSLPDCANSASCKSSLTQHVDNDSYGLFQGRAIIPPKIDEQADRLKPVVLGIDQKEGEKHIYINLETQTLYAFQGKTQVMKATISTGKWGRTPTGNFRIWTKLRSTRMSGGSGSDYYNLPNVPHVMYFYNDFGLHGAYWHNNFGHEMSHGCVNLRLVDAEKLFNWADGPTSSDKGTAVSICNSFTAPNLCIQEDPVT